MATKKSQKTTKKQTQSKELAEIKTQLNEIISILQQTYLLIEELTKNSQRQKEEEKGKGIDYENFPHI